MGLALLAACDRAPTGLIRPHDLAVGPGGEVFVADARQVRIAAFDRSGALRGWVGRSGVGPGDLWSIRGLDRLANGDLVVLNGTYKDPDDRSTAFAELKLFAPDGTLRLAAAISPLRADPPTYPVGVAALPDGFAVPDVARNVVMLFDSRGERTGVIDEVVGGPPLRGPNSVTWAAGELWITEYKVHRVRRLTTDGRQTLLLQDEGDGPGQLRFPYAIGVSTEGWFVVADLGNYRVQRFDAAGGWLGTIAPEPAVAGDAPQVLDVAVGADGRVFVVDSRGARVLVYGSDGTLLSVL